MAGARIRTVAAFGLVAALAGCGTSRLVPTADPADGVVRGGFATGFQWATRTGPAMALDPVDPAGLRAQVARSAAAVRTEHDDTFSLAIVASFPTATAAESEAGSLRQALRDDSAWFAAPEQAAERRDLLDPARDAPISSPAVSWLTEANVAPGTRGIGWGGAVAGSGDPADAVWTLGRTVFVTGLKAETDGTVDVPPIHPIAHRWAAAGGEVLVEGDRAGEGAIWTDVSCTPTDAAKGREVQAAIGDTLDLGRWSARPPWVAEPSADQAAARHDIAAYLGLAQTAATDPAMRDLLLRMATAGAAERQALMDALERRVKDQVHAAAPGRVSPDILALMERQPAADDAAALDGWDREVEARIGSVEERPDGSGPTADAFGPTAFYGTVRVRDGRLDIGSLAMGRASTGVPLLVAWLTERGCGGIRLAFADSEP